MTKEEIQASIKSIMFSGSVCGIEIYACLRDESGYQTKKIRATDKLLSSTKDKVAGFINCTYLADDAEFDTSENIADNKKEFYEISLIENYRPFIFLDDAEKRTEYYSESDRNKLSGFLFRINLNDKYFWVYQHIYSVSRIDRSKNVIALFVGDTYDEIDSDIVQIDSRADVIIFSSSVVTAKMDLMQRFFGFEQYIRAGAQKTIEIIRDLDIVDSLEKFVAFENKSKLTNAKKLLKAKNSPVLQMKKNDLLPFLSFSFFLIINKKERSRGVETSILSTCNNYKPRWKSNGVFFNRFFGGFVLRATLKSNFVASAMSCSIIEISLLRL